MASDQLIELDSSGAITKIQDSYQYTSLEMSKRIGYWVLIVIAAIFIIYLIYFIYNDLLKRKVFLLMKQLGIILPVVFLSMVVLSFSVYSSFSAELRSDTNKKLKILAGNRNIW
ncbi:hypothetical protein NV379_11395 [Paenibacillus sp. N1-5-1-14]|uniref:hypothetical protein n=1 Tax=Paenibacillus radicibacter TaxID=2972488 RepID=UPI0021598E28|nr:hypothetical protein [Paenibacillus radicibacter]MCR8643266.1 hypothetical protein [Paenibacillus radicibacter]